MDEMISTNPMTDEILWKGLATSEEGVDDAVKSARKAFFSWSLLTIEQRAHYLLSYKKNLEEQKEIIAEAISKETGKPLWEARGEVAAMAAKVDISIDAQKERCPEKKHDLLQGTSITRHKPIGVAAVFGPYNFPGHLPNGHIVPALLAGNTIVFKPSELTPYVAELMVNLWSKSGLPDGVLNLIQGGRATGKLLSNHSGVDALFFTGSWNTGKQLAEQCAAYPGKLLALEMGGNNPLVIGDISNLDAAACLIIQSAFLTSGQRCTSARRLILSGHKKDDELLNILKEMTENLHIGPYTDTPEPFMGPVISREAANKLLDAQKLLIDKGGTPLVEMTIKKPRTPLLTPAIIDVTAIKDKPDEEYFGPLLQVIRAASFEEAIEEANDTAFGLSAGIFTDDRAQYEAFYQRSRAGVVNWNTPLTGASSKAPFGGVGKSGNFRPSAFYAADYCNYPVASVESETLQLPGHLPPGIKERA